MSKCTYDLEMTIKCRLVEDAEEVKKAVRLIQEMDMEGNKAAMGLMAGALDDPNKVPELVLKADLRRSLKKFLERDGFDRIQISGKVTPKKTSFELIEASEKTYL
ncbi:hypothetical protein [Chromobacterium haemolyticum]|uniref:hypothetical protein n=1 Tax=Chromobacterium TaxID=535 RepID=UPI0040579C52